MILAVPRVRTGSKETGPGRTTALALRNVRVVPPCRSRDAFCMLAVRYAI